LPNSRFEGSNISHVLRLHDKRPIYRYVRTRDQFIEAVAEFTKSRYRYLHISAHADEEGMCTTNQDGIDYDELSDILTPALKGKRLFLDACSMVHDDMAKEIIPKTECYSVVGPKEPVAFTAAAVFWPAIYHLMFTTRDDAMKRGALREHLAKTASLFDVEIRYFSASSTRGYAEVILRLKSHLHSG
jgi:hypothetical protein